MLLRRWCLAVLFSVSVSVAWGQDKPPGSDGTAPVESPAAVERVAHDPSVPSVPTPPTMDVVVIEVTIAQWRTKADKEGEARSAPSLENVDLAALEKSGELRVKERIRLTTLDQQKAFFQRGESVPVVTGVSGNPRGGGNFGPQRSVNYQQVGTMVTVTPRIANDRLIIEAKIDRSSVENRDGPLLAKNDDGTETRAPNLLSGTTQSTVSVAPGKTVMVGGITRGGGDSSDGEVILISADLADRTSSPKPDDRGEGNSKLRRYATGLVKRFDENKNGALEPDEWKKMRRPPEKADGNDDKFITLDEFTKWLENLGSVVE